MYKQVHGTTMGSPVSVVVANLVMEDVKERALHLNGIEPSIKFTVEEERDGQLAFLDVLLRREDDGTISTSVHRKATHQPAPVLQVTPSNGTQSSIYQNSDDQSRELVFLGR